VPFGARPAPASRSCCRPNRAPPAVDAQVLKAGWPELRYQQKINTHTLVPKAE
jgi:hypothetical protein